MEWHEAVEAVSPHVVQISTPRGRGSGFFISTSETTDIIAVATAAHVVSDSNWWEEPIRLFHPNSGQSRILRVPDRVIHVEYEMDTAAILFRRDGFPLPQSPMAFIPEGSFLKVGNEIGWLGFPAIAPSPLDLCFFTGRVSAWKQNSRSYLVDGVAINGASGGPTFSITAVLIGIVSAYIPNFLTGQTLPGLSVIRDVKQFQELAKQFRSLDEASRQQAPPLPPTGAEIPSRENP